MFRFLAVPPCGGTASSFNNHVPVTPPDAVENPLKRRVSCWAGESELVEKLRRLEQGWNPFWAPPWHPVNRKVRAWEYYHPEPLTLLRWLEQPQDLEANLKLWKDEANHKLWKDFEEVLKRREVHRRHLAIERERVLAIRTAQVKEREERENQLNKWLTDGGKSVAHFS